MLHVLDKCDRHLVGGLAVVNSGEMKIDKFLQIRLWSPSQHKFCTVFDLVVFHLRRILQYFPYIQKLLLGNYIDRIERGQTMNKNYFVTNVTCYLEFAAGARFLS